LPFRILFAGLLLAALTSTPAAALDSKRIYQLNEDRVFQIRVLNRETGKKSTAGRSRPTTT
jgi:hypothetical protein